MAMAAEKLAEKSEEVFVLTEPKDGDEKFRHYSPSEQKLFKLLPKDGSRIASDVLTQLRKKKYKWDIEHMRNAVSVTMASLMNKIDENHEPFILLKTAQKGPYPVEFWLEALAPNMRSQHSRDQRRERVLRR